MRFLSVTQSGAMPALLPPAPALLSAQSPCAPLRYQTLVLLLPGRRRRGMGWSEGQSIGRNTKEEVTAKELVR